MAMYDNDTIHVKLFKICLKYKIQNSNEEPHFEKSNFLAILHVVK